MTPSGDDIWLLLSNASAAHGSQVSFGLKVRPADVVEAEPTAPGSLLEHSEMKRRAVKAESAVPASGAAAPSPDDIPVVHVPKRPRTQKLSELDDLDLGPAPNVVDAATMQAEAPSNSAPPTSDTAPRGTEGVERIGSGELSSKAEHTPGANRDFDEMPPPAPPAAAARRMPSLPRLGLHINIPHSNPGTPSE